MALVVLSAVSVTATADVRSILYAASIVLLALSAAVSFSTVRKGWKDLIRWTSSCDSAALLAMAAALVQAAVSFVLPASEKTAGTFCC